MANDNPNYEPDCRIGDVAATLMARDYKGPVNFARMNGVIERYL